MNAEPGFSKGYKYHGYADEPVSDACGDSKHSECTFDFTKCHCKYRAGHNTMHSYANPTIPAPQPVSGDAPKGISQAFLDSLENKVRADFNYPEGGIILDLIAEINRLRPYFPPASQTPPVDAFPEWWLKEWDDALASAQEYERDAANANPESGYAPQQTMTDEEIQVAQEATSTANVRRMIAEIRRLRVATPASTAREQKDKNDN